MDAAVSLHVHGALPPPPHHHRRALHIKPSASSSCKPPTRLTATARPRGALAAAPAVPTRSSSRAATGYAAALADASLRAGTLLRASRHARALLQPPQHQPRREEEEFDARVAALVRMLVGKGRAGMVAEVMAEFAAICDHLLLLPLPPASSS